MRHLNFNHLYYFWVVAREGSIVKAAEELCLTSQTISGQLRLLEDAVGQKIFSRAGRGLALTETGRVMFEYADEMFRLGTELRDVIKGRKADGPMVFHVGVADVVPKLIAWQLLQPAYSLSSPVRIVCREAHLDQLLADLAIHQIDMIIADAPMAPGINVKAFNHLLGESGVSFFAAPVLHAKLQGDFPQCLNDAPFLVPTSASNIRRALQRWFDDHELRPNIVGEFDDSALVKAFGQAGVGVFTAPSAIEAYVSEQFDVVCLGRTNDIKESFYAISAERKVKHPALLAIREAARKSLIGG